MALVDRAQQEYPDTPAARTAGGCPAHLGGTAPTPEEAVELERERLRRKKKSN